MSSAPARSSAPRPAAAALAWLLVAIFAPCPPAAGNALDESRGRDVQTPLAPPHDGPASARAEAALESALGRGLEWLAARQRETPDGGFPPVGALRERWAPVGVASLGALAFLASGSPPGRGPYGAEVSELVGYLADLTDLDPDSPTYGYVRRQGDGVSQNHGHGYATLALAEALGMSRGDERLQRVLTAAVHRIQDSQGVNGGWGYGPIAESFHEGSVTITLVQALRAANNAGVRVDPDGITRAEAYVRRLQSVDGTFRYTLDSERTSVALTAAAISTLNATGNYDDPAIQSGIDAIFRGLDRANGKSSEVEYPFYQRLYLAQALWQLSDPQPFKRWWSEERKAILSSQRADGSWGESPYGDCYATAVNCLVLAMPDGVLPIFQR